MGLNNLANLRVLDLSMNVIEKIENLDGLNQLEQLILYGNRIRIIENLDGMGNLKVLKVQNNRLLSISELALYDLHSLEILNAANNIIDTDELENSVKAAMALENLKELSLYGNLITDEPTYKFKFADHTQLVKLDGLELKPMIKQKLQGLKKDYEIDRLVESTKEEYFKRIEAERELKLAAANLLKKQQQRITDQYDNFIEYMEKDFDGFINYVYELKKNKELGRENEITDIDLYQWRRSLQEKEEERLKMLEDALNGFANKEKYMFDSQLLTSKDNEIFNTAIPPPDILSVFGKGGMPPQANIPNTGNKPLGGKSGPYKSAFTPAEQNKLDEVLKQYEGFKSEAESVMNEHRKLANDKSLHGDKFQRPPPINIPPLRNPNTNEFNEPSVSDQSEEQKMPNRNLKDEYNRNRPPPLMVGNQQPPMGQGMPQQNTIPPGLAGQPQNMPTEEEDAKDQEDGKKKGKKKKKKGKKEAAQPQNQAAGGGAPGQPPAAPPKKKSKGCVIF